jgi:hypothetical protein
MSFLDALLKRDEPLNVVLKEDITKAVTMETELYRIIKRKDNARLLAKSNITLKDVKRVIQQAIQKYQTLRTNVDNPKGNLPQIAWTRRQLSESRRAMGHSKTRQLLYRKPGDVSISDPSLIRDSLVRLKQYMDVEDRKIIDGVVKVLIGGKTTRPVSRKFSLQEEALNNVLIALETDKNITDFDRDALKEKKVLDDRFLVKLNNSMFKEEVKQVHPLIVNKLIEHDGLKKRKSSLYYKFERYIKAEFDKILPNPKQLAAVVARIEGKKGKRQTLVQIEKSILSETYKYSGNTSHNDLSKLITKLNGLIREDWEEIIDDFLLEEDDEEEWSIQALDEAINYNWDELDKEEQEEEDFHEFRGEQIIKFVEELEEIYKKILTLSKAIRTLSELINTKTGETQELQLPQVLKIMEQYKEINQDIKEYSTYKEQADRNVQEREANEEERRKRDKEEREEINAPKSEAEKEWEAQRYAEEREALTESEEGRKTQRETTTERTHSKRQVKDPHSATGYKTEYDPLPNIEALRERHKYKVREEIENAKEQLETAEDDEKEKIQEVIDRAERKLEELRR